MTAPAAALHPWVGFVTLFRKEWLRFWKVKVQTVLAPVLTALLYMLVFDHTLRDHLEPFPGVDYRAFLVPGLAMMALLQNSFANSSSSLIQSKMMGNVVFLLLPPLTHREFFGAYLLAAMGRGLVVAAGVFLATVWFVDLPLAHPAWALAFALLGAAVMGALGLVAGIRSEKIDQLAAFQNFVILPLTFLSGVFYSIHSLPPSWQAVSHANPVFYAIDGFRYGFFGVGDVSPWLALGVVAASFAGLSWLALALLESGYRMRT